MMNQYTIEISELIEMAWSDKVSFDDIKALTGFSESDIQLMMRQELKPSSYRLWRKRVAGRKSKHKKLKLGLANACCLV